MNPEPKPPPSPADSTPELPAQNDRSTNSKAPYIAFILFFLMTAGALIAVINGIDVTGAFAFGLFFLAIGMSAFEDPRRQQRPPRR